MSSSKVSLVEVGVVPKVTRRGSGRGVQCGRSTGSMTVWKEAMDETDDEDERDGMRPIFALERSSWSRSSEVQSIGTALELANVSLRYSSSKARFEGRDSMQDEEVGKLDMASVDCRTEEGRPLL